MEQYSDVLGGRCMEALELAADYKDPLRAGATWRSWWLFSRELMHADAGIYFLVTWLTDRGTGAHVPGTVSYTHLTLPTICSV